MHFHVTLHLALHMPSRLAQKKTSGFDTRRRLCGDRTEGESVGAQEAAGERVPDQSEHHRRRFGKDYQGAESENLLVRDRDIVPT